MLKVKRLSPHAVLPTVAHPGEDIGYDLYSAEDITLPPRGAAGVHTGIAIEFAPTAGGIVKTRSGMAKKRLMCNAGVIDAGYRGEVIVLMENLGDEPYHIRKGDKIAQLLEHPFLAGEVIEDELTDAAVARRDLGRAEARNPRKIMAEREGFEPPIPVKVCPLSRRIVSTTHAPLRAVTTG